jgi:hypothetical protein
MSGAIFDVMKPFRRFGMVLAVFACALLYGPAVLGQPTTVPSLVKPLTKEQLNKLLHLRIDGKMADSFERLSNMFFVSSRQQTPYSIALVGTSEEIIQSLLLSPFPSSYKPTVREYLDSLAIQTKSEWQYDPTDRNVKGETGEGKQLEQLAVFEFTKKDREKSFEVTLAAGWRVVDHGSWLMLSPPDFPVGLDIHEMGEFSSDDKAVQETLFRQIPIDLAFEWAQRASRNATREDLHPAKVGPFDAVYFEAIVATRDNQAARWRQWTFMVDNKCYFLVSTILLDKEKGILPDVQKMVASFRIRKQKPN